MRVNKRFGEVLRKIMQARDVQAKALAFKAGFTVAEVYRILNGVRRITLQDVETLAEALGMQPYELAMQALLPDERPAPFFCKKL